MAVELSPGVKRLFEKPNFPHLATLMPDGAPQVTPVWVALDGDRILVNTAEGRVKPRNVRRDPRVAISVADQANPYSAAFIRGRVVEITLEGAEELIDKLAKKYIGQDKYPWRQPGERRLTLVIEAEHVASMMVD
ncbi:MAG TPA: PPOX class F420-dependent oxidoreductase [Dehalococcoidia bacterium]|nr:PPOX class F420-dependent oxidoreductase [Dehalococcoidia bacterium]